MKMQIDYLVNHPHHIPPLAAWHHAMWGELDPTATIESRIDRLNQPRWAAGHSHDIDCI